MGLVATSHSRLADASVSAQPAAETRAGGTTAASAFAESDLERTSVTGSSTQHWLSPTMTQTEMRKQGLEGEPDLRIHRVSYDQLTLQLYIMLSGPMSGSISGTSCMMVSALGGPLSGTSMGSSTHRAGQGHLGR